MDTQEPIPKSITPDQSNPQERLKPEILTLPWSVESKFYHYPEMSEMDWDSVGDPTLKGTSGGLNRLTTQIQNSAWRVREAARISAAKLDAERPTVYGFFQEEFLGNIFLTTSMATGADAMLHYNIPANYQLGGRKFAHVEIRGFVGTGKKIVELLQAGYPVWSALIPSERLVFIRREGKYLRPNDMRHRDINGHTETVIINNQPVLWDDHRWLDEENLLASIAATYLALQKKVGVDFVPKFPNGSLIDDKTRVLIAQAVTHMTVKTDKFIPQWITINDALYDFPRYSLVFSDLPDRIRNSQIVNPRNIIITEEIKSLTERMRNVFSQSWPKAHHEWSGKG